MLTITTVNTLLGLWSLSYFTSLVGRVTTDEVRNVLDARRTIAPISY